MGVPGVRREGRRRPLELRVHPHTRPRNINLVPFRHRDGTRPWLEEAPTQSHIGQGVLPPHPVGCLRRACAEVNLA